jgi:predicted DNA binding CopG/RHH family protein
MGNKLSSEEQEILDLFEQGKLKAVKNTEQKIALARNAAKQHLKKDQRINIRLSSFDLDRIKRISAHEGLPYQTLIASILHKYAGLHTNS